MTICAVPALVGTVYTIGTWSAGDAAPVIDTSNNEWSVTQEQGLMHSPAPRTNVIDREQSDGVFDGDTWLPGRAILLAGVVKSPDFPTLYAAMRTVRGLLTAGSRRQALHAAYPDISVQTIVRRDGETLVDKTVNRNPSATFSLVLYAPDPNLYSDALHSASTGVFAASGGRAYPTAYPDAYGAAGTSGIVTVANAGDATTFPVITISAGSGPLVNPSITEVGGLALVFSLSMNAGDTLTIDTGARTVLLNGAGARPWPIANGTLGCAPGNTQLLFGATSAAIDASMSVTYRDAYQ